MRAIGIVGYKNSGKTTLSHALAQELVKRGHRVAAVKHSSESMDILGTDTSKLKEFADQVGFVSPEESGMSADRLITMTAAAALLGIHLRTLTRGIARFRSYGLIDLYVTAEDEKDADEDTPARPHARRVQESSVTACIQNMADERRRELGRRIERLTPVQREVMDLIVAGKSNKLIARQLDIGIRTVEARRHEVFDQMQAESVAELVRLAIEAQS